MSKTKITIVKDYWPNGKPKYEYLYKNDRLCGASKWWYENGQLKCYRSHENDVSHGISKWWYKSGKLNCKRYYIYGKRVSKKEYRKHELIESLSGLKEDTK